MSRIYICYSVRLRDYLISEGVRYECIGINPENQKYFWVFVRDQELSEALSKWGSVKHD